MYFYRITIKLQELQITRVEFLLKVSHFDRSDPFESSQT